VLLAVAVGLIGIATAAYLLQRGVELAPRLTVSTCLALSPLVVFAIGALRHRRPDRFLTHRGDCRHVADLYRPRRDPPAPRRPRAGQRLTRPRHPAEAPRPGSATRPPTTRPHELVVELLTQMSDLHLDTHAVIGQVLVLGLRNRSHRSTDEPRELMDLR